MTVGSRDRTVIPIPLPTPFPVGDVNAFLITGEPPILVDTGVNTDESFAALAQAVQSHGYGWRDIRTVLVTHGHLDHVGALARVLEASGAEAFAHPYAVEQAAHYDDAEQQTKDFTRSILHEMGAPPEVIHAAVTERDTYSPYGAKAVIGHPLGDLSQVEGFTVYHVPGHSPSDVLFVNEEGRYAFSGDHVLKGINPNPIIRRPRPGQGRARSLVEYRASLMRTRSLPVETLYPGHGGPIHDHVEIIDRILSRHQRRQQKIVALMEERCLAPFELCTLLFPDLDRNELFLGVSVAVGHLELLEEEGRAVCTHEDGVARYCLKD